MAKVASPKFTFAGKEVTVAKAIEKGVKGGRGVSLTISEIEGKAPYVATLSIEVKGGNFGAKSKPKATAQAAVDEVVGSAQAVYNTVLDLTEKS